MTKIKLPNDVFNRVNRGTKIAARYVLADEPLKVYITATREYRGECVRVAARVDQADDTDIAVSVCLFEKNYEPVNAQADLRSRLESARADALDFLRHTVVTYKAALNAAKK